jgi:small-conductance mechanosensitive channel
MAHVLRCLLFGLALALTAAMPASGAEQKPSVPAGLSQEQFDSLAKAISQAVIQQLKQDGVVAGPPKTDHPTGMAQMGAGAGDEVARFGERAKAVLGSFPEIFSNAARLGTLLDEWPRGGHGLFTYLAMLLLAAALALGAERLVHWLSRGPREHLVAGQDRPVLGRVVLLALLDLVGVAAMAGVSYLLVAAWFPGATGQGRLAAAVLDGLVMWRLYALAFRIFLRPECDSLRIVPITTPEADTLYRGLIVAVLATIVARSWVRILLAIQTPTDAVACMMIINGFAVMGALLAVIFRSRRAVADWFAWLADGSGATREIQLGLARNWASIAVPALVVMWGAQVFGAITDRLEVPQGIALTLNLVIGLLLFESLVDFVGRSNATAADAATGGPTLRTVIARCLRMAVVIGVLVTIAGAWIVDILGFVDSSRWSDIMRSSVTAGTILFSAFVAWQIVDLVTGRGALPAPGAPADEDQEAMTGASRLRTLMPLMRIALLVVIVIVAGLLVLSELGVNITPLIAGASVFGLAISFGSQALVRDVVSGIFYLADDAFRVGEYIDCGKAKGTVEGFTLRSLRLRHQSGQIHTIPFGQLGQITNFSRDWSTVKFNLRFTRDVDLEKLRKTVKKIGSEMAEDPEYKEDFLEPLKMQGVADIQDNAMVVRFKFTVRPSRPSFIQREAVKRMVRAFKDNGIEFANSTVAVQAIGGAYPAPEAAAAAKAQADTVAAQQAAAALARG